MRPLSFKRHRLPADAIQQAVWLFFRFTLSFRDVEELLAQRGIDVSYEAIRCWTIEFDPQIARNLKRRRPAPSPRWSVNVAQPQLPQRGSVGRQAIRDDRLRLHRLIAQ